jgi:hypothetical protein
MSRLSNTHQGSTVNTLAAIGFVILLGIGYAWHAGLGPFSEEWQREYEARQAQRAAEEAAKEAACMKDLDCLMDKKGLDMEVSCNLAIEARAKYDHKWESANRYPLRAWHKEGVVYLAGDAVKFQNGIGAWQRHSYECLVTPDAQVVGLRIKPGRI